MAPLARRWFGVKTQLFTTDDLGQLTGLTVPDAMNQLSTEISRVQLKLHATLHSLIVNDLYRSAMNDPNFPSNLNIRPLHLTPSDSSDVWKQQEAIRQYGIAGRVW